MKTCFNIIRWILSILVGTLLVLIITVGIPVASLTKALSNPDNVKTWLDEGEVYENLSEVIVEVMENQTMENLPEGYIEEEEEEILESFKKVLPSDWLKFNTEKIIDSVYEWFEGNTDYPEFKINLSDRRGLLVDEFTRLLKHQIENLPECTEEELKEMEGKEYNPFEATCFPSDIDISEMDKQIEEKFEEEEILQEDVFNSKDFFENDQNINENLERVNEVIRFIYPISKNIQTIIIIAIIVASVLLFFLIPGISNGFIVTGLTWIISSFFLLTGSLLSRVRFDNLYQSQLDKLSDKETEVFIDLFRKPIELASKHIQGDVKQFALVLVVIGLIFIIGGIILKFSKKRYYIEDDSERQGEELRVEKKDAKDVDIRLK